MLTTYLFKLRDGVRGYYLESPCGETMGDAIKEFDGMDAGDILRVVRLDEHAGGHVFASDVTREFAEHLERQYLDSQRGIDGITDGDAAFLERAGILYRLETALIDLSAEPPIHSNRLHSSEMI